MRQGRTVRAADTRRRDDGEAGDEEARSHQDDKHHVNRDGDLKSGGFEIDAEAD